MKTPSSSITPQHADLTRSVRDDRPHPPEDSTVSTPKQASPCQRQYVIDSVSGLRVTTAVNFSDPVTSEMVRVAMEDYP